MNRPRTFGIWGNSQKTAFWEFLPQIMKWAKASSLDVFFTIHIIERLEDKRQYTYNIIESAEDFHKLDFILALGGDGTILSLARAVAQRNIPILGVHLGKLGFLSEVTTDKMFTRLNQVISGEYQIQKRMVLKGSVKFGGDDKIFYALNDLVVDRGASSRLLSYLLKSNNHMVAKYQADGLIISTPTGSTAYSLSAGGPVVDPTVSSIIISPICPHSLTFRPIVLSGDSRLSIEFPDKDDKASLSVDGQITELLDCNSKIIVEKGEYYIQLITFKDSSYFKTLRVKMDWGKRGES